MQGLLWPLLTHLVSVRNQDTEKSCTFELKLCVLARRLQAFLRRKGLTREIQYCITMNFAASYEITALLSKKAEFSRAILIQSS